MKEKGDVGRFISAYRQALGLTQKQLAERLHVTDKAVSKWERGQGYPDISTLPLLAEVLGVSVDEILGGSHEKPGIDVRDTMETIREFDPRRMEKVTRWVWFLMSLSFLVAILVCGICDYAVNGSFTWSLYSIVSVVFAWLVFTPALVCQTRRVGKSLLALTVTILPFLYGLLYLANETEWFMPLCVPVGLLSLVFIWFCYLLLAVRRKNLWYSLGVIVLVVAGLDFAVDAIVGAALNEPRIDGWSLLSILICVIAAVVLFAVGKRTGGKVPSISLLSFRRGRRTDDPKNP